MIVVQEAMHPSLTIPIMLIVPRPNKHINLRYFHLFHLQPSGQLSFHPQPSTHVEMILGHIYKDGLSLPVTTTTNPGFSCSSCTKSMWPLWCRQFRLVSKNAHQTLASNFPPYSCPDLEKPKIHTIRMYCAAHISDNNALTSSINIVSSLFVEEYSPRPLSHYCLTTISTAALKMVYILKMFYSSRLFSCSTASSHGNKFCHKRKELLKWFLKQLLPTRGCSYSLFGKFASTKPSMTKYRCFSMSVLFSMKYGNAMYPPSGKIRKISLSNLSATGFFLWIFSVVASVTTFQVILHSHSTPSIKRK